MTGDSNMRLVLAAWMLMPLFAMADRDIRLPPEVQRLNAWSARFAPVDIRVDLSGMPPSERQALAHLIRAARITEVLHLRQVWAGNEALLFRLLADTTIAGRARLDYFILNKGPWSRLDDDAPFVAGVPEKPESANYYPAGATRAEVEAWIAGLQPAERRQATGFFTTIRRDPAGTFKAVPYSLEYQGELAEMARHLRAAAAVTTQPTLKAFLEARAAAFISNDYYASDVAWMKLDASIEPTIGPYEVYEDEWFNYKAAFEAFITVRDDAETAKLERFGAELQWLEDRLPIDAGYRRKALGGLAPMRVVNVVFAAGEGNSGVQTAAFNLPNDERIVSEMGSKRTMLKNFQHAKFDHALLPISKVALAGGDQANVNFDAFFTHILMHELMHGLGPTHTGAGGQGGGVRESLKELYSAVEEAKADVSGLWALQQLMDKGVLDGDQERAMYTTFLASAFRTLRFGMSDSHARGMALQVNYLLDAGGFRVSPDGTFSVDLRRVKKGVTALSRDLLTLQATGDYDGAKALLGRLVVIRPEVKTVLVRLDDVAVDIRPKFLTAEDLERELR
ncbi:MAG: dipeptidyl-peptidase 3 family protein [Steroidobacteraceae bacterium]